MRCIGGPDQGVAHSERVPVSLTRFMNLMRGDAARDLVRRINRFTQEMEVVRKPDPVKDSRLVQNFLVRMENDVLRHRVYSSLSDGDKTVLLEGVEMYTMTKLYKRTFGRYREDQERDALVSSRLFALQFVTPAHLDIPSNIITSELMLTAMRELQKINAYKSPRDKLASILNCCQVILNLLHTNGEATGADAFMPVLNYVVIKTQPIHLVSNIEYIRRFRQKSRLVSQADYYFTQLCAAAYFIESATAGSFTDGRQEFLSSFLQQGLISWKQYEEALQDDDSDESSTQCSAVLVTARGSAETSQMETDVGLGNLEDLNSLTNAQLTGGGINWAGFSGVEQLEKDGHPIVNQLAAAGDLTIRYPYLSLHTVDLKVEDVDQLLAEYKTMALTYEVLAEAAEQKDSHAVLKLITEYEIKAQYRSAWPSERQLLAKYPFLCSAFQDLSVKDTSKLLNGYKVLVLKCESLMAGVKRRIHQGCALPLDGEEFEVIEAETAGRESLEDAPPIIARLTGESSDVLSPLSNPVAQSNIPVPVGGIPTPHADVTDILGGGCGMVTADSCRSVDFPKGDGSWEELGPVASIGSVISNKVSNETSHFTVKVTLHVIDSYIQMNLSLE